MCVILISTTYIYWQWRKGKRRNPIGHSVILVWLGGGNAGYGKGMEMVYFSRETHLALNVWLFWDPFTLHWEEVMNGYRRRLFFGHLLLCYLVLFLLCLEFFFIAGVP